MDSNHETTKKCQFCHQRLTPITLSRILDMIGLNTSISPNRNNVGSVEPDQLKLEVYRCSQCGQVYIFVPPRVEVVINTGRQLPDDSDQGLKSVLDSIFRETERSNGMREQNSAPK